MPEGVSNKVKVEFLPKNSTEKEVLEIGDLVFLQ